MRFRWIVLTLAFWLLAALALGCITAAPPSPTATPVPPTPTLVPPTSTPTPIAITPTAEPTAVPAAFPLTITDSLGREVTITTLPRRLVSLAPSNTEILFAVGAGDRIVGVTEYCNYPPEAKEGREIVGGFSAKSLSVEKILSLQPDVVFSAGAIHQPVIEALEQAGVTVVALDAQSFDEVYQNILTAGRITGHIAEAEKVVAEMKDRLAKVQAIVGQIPEQERPRVFYEVWDEPLMTAGPDTFIGQMIELAGGINVFADVKEQYPQISPEAVVERNPDVILGPDSHAEGLTAEKIAARPGWGDIKAVRDGRILIVNGDIVSRPGPRIVEAVETIARLLYPERFP
ncbi:MAG: ABC transporter substrate-binding protein [Anaerolineae bacterium]|nr:ABC transporter substrate-binding protein [Anaerolineae bacterium]MDW8100939.1 ABC transporter substrate-binding protein [Anaerolineae bacterium]